MSIMGNLPDENEADLLNLGIGTVMSIGTIMTFSAMLAFEYSDVELSSGRTRIEISSLMISLDFRFVCKE